MKIAFWSNTGGRAGTTSNMACISAICSMLTKKKSIILENHYSINNLEHIFVNNKVPVHNFLREQFAYFDQTGLESLIKRIHSNRIYENIIDDMAINFLGNLIYYLPGNANLNHEYFEYELNQVIHPLLDFLDQAADYVFIDTASRNHLSTKTILDKADLVVVNLCQNKQVIENYFHNYQSLSGKAIILVGNYQPQSLCSYKNIRKCYHVSKESIGIIPYNVEFHDSLSTGTMIEFLTRNFMCRKEDNNFYFIKELKRSAKIILNRKEERKEESRVVY